MNTMIKKRQQKMRRAHRTRAKIRGTAVRPRLSVFRSAKHLTVQVIDDQAGRTLLAVHDGQVATTGKPVERARALGLRVAERVIAAGITTVIFDRGSYAYHGRIQAVAEGAREGGLVF